jgi:hypothetical protein
MPLPLIRSTTDAATSYQSHHRGTVWTHTRLLYHHGSLLLSTTQQQTTTHHLHHCNANLCMMFAASHATQATSCMLLTPAGLHLQRDWSHKWVVATNAPPPTMHYHRQIHPCHSLWGAPSWTPSPHPPQWRVGDDTWGPGLCAAATTTFPAPSRSPLTPPSTIVAHRPSAPPWTQCVGDATFFDSCSLCPPYPICAPSCPTNCSYVLFCLTPHCLL